MLDLNDVTTFVHVVRCGSFAEAARQRRTPSTTVSRRVQMLETQLGTRLMQRSTRRLTLTSAGQSFYDRCAGYIDGLHAAGEDLASGSAEPTGFVRVAAPADFFDFFPMAMVTSFLANHPLVRLAFVLSDAIVDLVAEKVDVALRGGPLQDSGYIGRQLLVREDTLLASPTYISMRGQPTTLASLQEHDCVTASVHGGYTTWNLVDSEGRSHEIEVKGRFMANTAQAQRKATLAGLGIVMLPPSMAMQDIREGRLIRVLPDFKLPRNALSVVYPSRRQLPAAVIAFIGVVVDQVNSGLLMGIDPPA